MRILPGGIQRSWQANLQELRRRGKQADIRVLKGLSRALSPPEEMNVKRSPKVLGPSIDRQIGIKPHNSQ